jgi:hypothetical protein
MVFNATLNTISAISVFIREVFEKVAFKIIFNFTRDQSF